jgi:hypothetical protein
MRTADYEFPTVYDGLRGMQFIYKAVESADRGAVWVPLPSPALAGATPPSRAR